MNCDTPEKKAFYDIIEKECHDYDICRSRGLCHRFECGEKIAPIEFDLVRQSEKAEATKKENDLTIKILTDLSDFEKSLAYDCRFLGADNKKLIRDRFVDILCSGIFKEKFKP